MTGREAYQGAVHVHRSLAFPIEVNDSALTWLLKEFRILVNEAIRIAVQNNLQSRKRLTQVGYAELSRTHQVYKQYIPSAFEVALAVLKAYRRRVRRGLKATRPWVRRLFLKAENQSYSLDRSSGLLRIPIRSREHVALQLPISSWHRGFFEDSSWKLGSVTLTEKRVILVVSKLATPAYAHTGLLALDANVNSMDGVLATPQKSALVTLSIGDVSQVQMTHFRRAKKLSSKKAHDRRVSKELVGRERRREVNRVRSRLHVASRRIVDAATRAKAALVLEALTLTKIRSFSRRRSRALNAWPRGELSRQIEYKAALAGVPIIKVNPAWTSKTCPVCGARRRDRVGQDFVCLRCDWEMDRQHNAGLNILNSALASNEALARAVRFRPGALRDDVVIPLCDLPALLADAREEPSGVESARQESPTESKAYVLRANRVESARSSAIG